MKRGDVVVVRATGSPASKARPCIVVQRDSTLDDPAKVTLCPLTSKLIDHSAARPLLVPNAANGLQKTSQVEVDWLHTFPVAAISSVIGTVDAGGMKNIDTALRLWLDL